MKAFQQLTRRKVFSRHAIPRVIRPQAIASTQLWQRSFSASAASASQVAGLDASKLTVMKTSTPKELTPPKDLVFGKAFTGRVVS